MNVLRIGLNILIPFFIGFLAFATWMGYIAEHIRDDYNFKWIALLLMIAGYIIQFYKRTVGYVLVGLSVWWWFVL
ncbi:hypothetical protein [Bacillus sp. KH172YL63]|uniref:hypothetical protein n=1 Tax=Bacillus sp. KH172YL63 TaxID=2709784 RepID=UPI0013E4C818|nr:hypothetical protein [Bacillus sp. KH172YL63]BCB05219.1 hypothetical protein KH172YL63_33520 [Bacillus sp. KH172YL63]